MKAGDKHTFTKDSILAFNTLCARTIKPILQYLQCSLRQRHHLQPKKDLAWNITIQ